MSLPRMLTFLIFPRVFFGQRNVTKDDWVQLWEISLKRQAESAWPFPILLCLVWNLDLRTEATEDTL